MSGATRGLAIAVAVGVGAGAIAMGRPGGCAVERLPRPVEAPRGSAIHLGASAKLVAIEVPADSRDGEPVPDALPIDGPWTSAGRNPKGGHVFTMPVPFRPRGLFFMSPQPGMSLSLADGTPLEYQRGGQPTRPIWSHDRDTLTVVMPTANPPPPLVFRYEAASERERALNFAAARAAGLVDDEAAFVRQATVQEGWTSRTGLLLPAPARVAFEVDLPEAAVLSMSPGLVRPELGLSSRSDGCSLRIEVDDGTGPVAVFDEAMIAGEFPLRRIDLSAWAERTVTVSFSTLSGPTTRYDYCFVGDPVIAPHAKNPRTVLLVFVDTLRPDHLSLYGYERPTSARLEAFAERATVFENARSIAPWTLPSARTVLTGRHPERYDQTPTLQALAAAQGFATGMIAGNVYLSANFGMTRDWGFHDVGMFPPANEVTDQALAWLDAHRGQDALLLVHYMSTHLPYREPLADRFRYAAATDHPAGLPLDFFRTDINRARLDEAGRAYVRDRYDNTVHWVDAEVGRLFDRIDDNDVVVFFSDHGEEFWDHGGFEHGHTLFDELLRVPLVVRAPGLPAGRVDAPVSLLDVTPTVLDALGIDAPELDGASLLPVARGDAGAADALAARPQAFGRPLYGAAEQWGVLDGAMKWTTDRGREALYDLSVDPGESRDRLRVAPTEAEAYRARLGQALGRPSGVGYRLHPVWGTSRTSALVAELHVPGGVAHAWAGDDPLQRSELDIEHVDAETVRFTWRGAGTREAFVMPARPVADVTHALCLTTIQGRTTSTQAVPAGASPVPSRQRTDLLRADVPGGSLTLGWSMAPVPPEGALQLDATDSEMTDALQQIGYLHDEPEPTETTANPASTRSPCAPR